MNWICRTRIGLAGDIVAGAPWHTRESSLGPLQDWIDQQIDLDNPRDTSVLLSSLPPEALRALLQIYRRRAHRSDSSDSDGDTGRLVLIESACNALLTGDEPPVSKARLLAHHILYGDADARQIAHLASSLSGRKSEPRSLDDLADALAVLRDASSHTEDLLASISTITERALRRMHHVAQLENFLCRTVFAWPLLVVEGLDCGCSLPVAVDVDLRHEGDKYLTVEVPDLKTSRMEVNWRDSLEISMRSAKDLWRSKHGGWGHDFIRAVEKAKCHFSFSWAAEIASPPVPKVILCDRSAEAYFAQVILSRFLGQPRGILAAVSGQIGERCRREDGNLGLDRHIEPPSALTEKLRYVYRTGFFERAVFPHVTPDWRPPRVRIGEKLTEGVPVDVCRARKLSNAADAVQTRGWRRETYVRADDIRIWIHKTPERYEHISQHAAAQSFWRNALKERDQTALKVECSDMAFAAKTLVSMLFNLNLMFARRELDSPPALSWSIIRMIEGEQDLRFFKTVHRACGASQSHWERLLRIVDWDAAALALAEVLNVFEARVDAPQHRAPDLVILLCPDKLTNVRPLNPLHRRYLIPEILKRLPDHVIGPSDRRYYPHVGNTRLVLLTDGSEAADRAQVDARFSFDPPPPLRVAKTRTPDADAALERLSVFRFGFSHLGACLVLQDICLNGWETLRLLEHLVGVGLLEKGQNTYMMPFEVRNETVRLMPKPPTALARPHLMAAAYYAPYFMASDFPAVPADEAFLPWHLHEAQHHLREALQLAKHVNDKKTQIGCNKAERVFFRYCGDLSWGQIDSLLKSNSMPVEAHEQALELLDRLESLGIPHHPRWLQMTGDATLRRAYNCSPTDRSQQGERSDLLRQAGEYFERAVEVSEEPRFGAEAEFNQLLAKSSLATFLLKEGDDAAKQRALRIGRGLLAIAEEPDDPGFLVAVRGDTWELLGDESEDDEEALMFYSAGCLYAATWHQLWLKKIGTLLCLGQQLEAESVLPYIDGRPLTIRKSIEAARKVIRTLSKPKPSSSSAKRGLQRMVAGFECVRNLPVAARFRKRIDAILKDWADAAGDTGA